MSSQFPEARPRRLRRNASLRSLFQETEFSLNDLVLPIFVEVEIDDFVPIKSMPGVVCPGRDQVGDDVRRVGPFGRQRQRHLERQRLVSRMSRIAKDAVPDMIVMSDTCFCEYTDHGHRGGAAQP